MEPPDSLPRFKRAPLNEVSIGLIHHRLDGMRSAHYGAFWSRIKANYPESEDKGQVVLGPGELPGSKDWFPLPRVWFVHKDRNLLIQIQPNGFWLNWRKQGTDPMYPHFEHVQETYQRTLDDYLSFLDAENLGTLKPIGAQISYVNQIPIGELWESYSDLSGIFREFRKDEQVTDLGKRLMISNLSIHTHDDCSLRVDIKSAQEVGGQERPLIVLELTAQSPTDAINGVEDAKSWYLKAHAVIITAFCGLTTERAHGVWGKNS